MISLERNSTLVADPTDHASDRYNIWEQASLFPEGLSFGDSIEDVFLTSFQVREQEESTVWHSRWLPDGLPEGWVAENWRGGWLLGFPAALDAWEENPGEMAAKWHPRSDGLIRLERESKARFQSQFIAKQGSTVLTETTWLTESLESISPPIASEWLTAWEVASEGGFGLEECHMSRWDTPNGIAPDSSLLSFWNGSWSTWKWQSGETLEIWGWSDSTGFKSKGIGEIHPDGWYRWEGNRKPAAWNEFSALLHDSKPRMLSWDGIDWNSSSCRLGMIESNERIAWVVNGSEFPPRDLAVQVEDDVVDLSSSQQSALLALVQNHRLKKQMAVTWEPPFAVAAADGRNVWRKEMTGDDQPQVWEVDLYRNGKYQVALADENAFHIIDVLGREVTGYPVAPSTGVTASAVIDYDRNRNYRIFIGTGDGKLLNLREEGNRTPGWNFNPIEGRVIVHVRHIRVGNRDYLYAGQDDGSIRLLKRSGADRFESSVSVPSNQIPCFRLAQSIASSTVIYVDGEGWIQERTFGTNEAVGMSRMTRGLSVTMEDRDDDGIQELIVQTNEGEEVWDSRNERVSL